MGTPQLGGNLIVYRVGIMLVPSEAHLILIVDLFGRVFSGIYRGMAKPTVLQGSLTKRLDTAYVRHFFYF
jgi:hypothetical protein